jgi:hypothetical protein
MRKVTKIKGRQLKRRRRVEWKQYRMHLREVVEKEKVEAEVKEVEEEEELEQTQPKHLTLLNPNHNYHQPLLNTIQLPHHHLNKQNQTR